MSISAKALQQFRVGVGNLWLASQMWLFWWPHLASLIFS